MAFNKEGCQIYNQNGNLVAKASLLNDTYKLKTYERKETQALLSHTDNDIFVWHQRMGHLNFTDVSKIPQCTEGVKISNKKHDYTCVTCLEGKQTRLPFPSNQFARAHSQRCLRSDE